MEGMTMSERNIYVIRGPRWLPPGEYMIDVPAGGAGEVVVAYREERWDTWGPPETAELNSSYGEQDDAWFNCDGCGRTGTVEDGIIDGDLSECPDEDCTGIVHLIERKPW
jgi:hypothetical protein